MIRIARFVTFVLHPMVLVSPAVFFIVFISSGSYPEAFFWTLITLIFLLVVASYILLGMRVGFFSNFDVSKRKQRIYLFPFVIAAGLLFLLSLQFFNGPRVLFFAILYFIIAVVILAGVNLKIKASIHVGSLTAVIISAIYYFGNSFLPFLILIPVMAWARIIEKRHTFRETVAGFIMGAILAFAGIIVVYYLI